MHLSNEIYIIKTNISFKVSTELQRMRVINENVWHWSGSKRRLQTKSTVDWTRRRFRWTLGGLDTRVISSISQSESADTTASAESRARCSTRAGAAVRRCRQRVAELPTSDWRRIYD